MMICNMNDDSRDDKTMTEMTALRPRDVKQMDSELRSLRWVTKKKPKTRKRRRVRRVREKVKVREEIDRVVAQYVANNQSPAMIATQALAARVQNRLNLLKKQKSNFNEKDNNIVESNSSSIRLLLRSKGDATNRRVQEPSGHRPFGSVTMKVGECLPESRNVERAKARRSPPVLP